MRTNIELDSKLIAKAQSITHLKTKKEVVHFALEELIKQFSRRKFTELFGKVKWEGNLDEMRKA